MKVNLLGIDVGGTNTKAALVEYDGQGSCFTAWRTTKPTPADYDSALKLIHSLFIEAQQHRQDVGHIGIGVAGTVDKAGSVVAAGAAQWLVKHPLQADLGKLLNNAVTVENDVRCFAIAEGRLGQGKDFKDFAAIALGTGIAAGLVLNGQIYRGAFNGAGEIGHTFVHTQTAMEAKADIELESYASQHFFSSRSLDPEQVFEAAEQGDANATEAWTEFGRWLGLGIVNLINTFEPSAVIIGGGLVKAAKYFLPETSDYVSKRAHSPNAAANTKILLSNLGQDANALGAALHSYHS